MGAGDLLIMQNEELEQRLEESRRELFNLRFQLATGQLDNTARLRHVRRDVARILTVLRERDITEAEAIAAGDALDSEPLFAPARRVREEQEAEADKTATARRRRAAAPDEADESAGVAVRASGEDKDQDEDDADRTDEQEGDA
jgi:large subunit ribosomal protein L29